MFHGEAKYEKRIRSRVYWITKHLLPPHDVSEFFALRVEIESDKKQVIFYWFGWLHAKCPLYLSLSFKWAGEGKEDLIFSACLNFPIFRFSARSLASWTERGK